MLIGILTDAGEASKVVPAKNGLWTLVFGLGLWPLFREGSRLKTKECDRR
jgi:hypothetical protein